jgi:hypothetical protein
MLDWDHGQILGLVSMYETAFIEKEKFIHILKQVAIQYVETKEQSHVLFNKEISNKGFFDRMNSMIK